MEGGFTLIVKFGDRGLAKRCSAVLTHEELVASLLAKWDGISKADILLSYDLLGSGELDLAEEEDMVTPGGVVFSNSR